MASGKPWFAKNYALTHLCWTNDSWVTNRYWPMQVTYSNDAITPSCALYRQDCRNAVHGKAFPKGF